MSTDEVTWFKSSYSGGGGDNCVEIAVRPGTVVVRDSKTPDSVTVAVSRDAWSAFTTLASAGRM